MNRVNKYLTINRRLLQHDVTNFEWKVLVTVHSILLLITVVVWDTVAFCDTIVVYYAIAFCDTVAFCDSENH